MRILFVSAEVAPFSKTGGLGDVADALPAALQTVGHELMVVSPYYRRVAEGDHTLHRVYQGLRLAALNGFPVDVLLAQDGRNWFIDSPHFFDREGLYRNDGDEHRRFLLAVARLPGTVSQAPMGRRHRPRQRLAHGSTPSLSEESYRNEPSLSEARSIFTIHNLAYQGGFGCRHRGRSGPRRTAIPAPPRPLPPGPHQLHGARSDVRRLHHHGVSHLCRRDPDPRVRRRARPSPAETFAGSGRDSQRHRRRHLESPHRSPDSHPLFRSRARDQRGEPAVTPRRGGDRPGLGEDDGGSDQPTDRTERGSS